MRRICIGSGSLVLEDREDPVDQLNAWSEVFTHSGVHELLFDSAYFQPPAFLAIFLAANNTAERPMMWVDPSKSFYPPAAGAFCERIHILRPRSVDLAWTAVECLRCKEVGAVVAVMLHRPSRVDVRRIQLAAEHSGGLGILLRPNAASAGSGIYAATSRWLVSSVPGEETIQRWRIDHVHGHGRQFGQSFIVEKHRATGQTNFVYPSAALGDHSQAAADSGKLNRVAS